LIGFLQSHLLFCKIRRVPVLDVCFFRFGNPAGYVVHGDVKDFTSIFLIAVGPFIINSLLCVVICFPAYFPMQVFDVTPTLSPLLLWLGISIGMHAFPSNQDARILVSHAREAARNGNVLAIISFPLVGLIFLANLLSFFWIDLIYGVALGIGVPSLIF
jgi:hypothetical protein